MHVSIARTDAERQEAQDLLASQIPDIDPAAVPKTAVDDMYRPIVPLARDDSGRPIAAAVVCRSSIAVGAAMAHQLGTVPTRLAGFVRVLDRHRELDLLAVLPDARRHGVGRMLIQFLEDQLRAEGVQVWSGCATDDLAVSDLRRFYQACGFSVTGPSESLPPFFGYEWARPDAEAAFWFYKEIPR